MIDLGQFATAEERRHRRGKAPAVDVETRQALCAASLERVRSSAPFTLDGRPAIIRGAFMPFATVSDNDGREFSWAWSTVRRIVAAGGRFQS